MEQSPRLSLSYVAPNQAQKHVTVNETFRRLDAVVQASVRSRTETEEPADPDEGDAYVIPSGASGDAWDGFGAGDLAAFQDGAWARVAPFEGLRVWVADSDEFVIYDGAAWGALAGGGSSETAAQFGINATADATNRLAVKSDAALFNHDDATPGTGDIRVVVNKAAAGGTGSVVFQTAASGRAEFGLAGDDDFHVKVSPDNFATSFEAVLIDKDNGRVAIGGASPEEKLHVQGGAVLCDNNYGLYVKDAGGIARRVFHLGTDDRCYFNANGLANSIRLQTNGANRVSIEADGGVVVGSPTGGGKGAGTLNASGLYDDNTLLTCYVFDQALDGAVDAAKWDGKVPDTVERDDDGKEVARIKRAHLPMRKFAARIGTAYDPLTLDGYARHWREKRHLASMPNEASFDPEKGMAAGEWIQRLVETVEIQAVLIEKLNERMTAMEARGAKP